MFIFVEPESINFFIKFCRFGAFVEICTIIFYLTMRTVYEVF